MSAASPTFADRVRQLPIDITRGIVVGSGILDQLNIRRSRDIDFVVPSEDFKRYRQDKGGFTPKSDERGTYLAPNGVDCEIADNWYNSETGGRYTYQEVLDRSVVIDGVRFVTLDFLKQWKVSMGRSKDLEDVVLIEEYERRNHE